MKKIFAAVTAALAVLSFSAVLFAAEPEATPAMPAGHPPIGDKAAKPAKKAKKAKKSKAKKEEAKPTETPAAK